jgi:DNA-binding GntR family transcriptional regulator
VSSFVVVQQIENKRIIATIKDQVYEVLKENILNGHYVPGQRIQELQIAEELKVSRSPVRSAINELIGEGLLESIPNKSVLVRRLSDKDIVDAYEFRLVIEKYAIAKTIEMLDDGISSRLREFRQSFIEHGDYADINAYFEIDTAFHDYLVSTAGNKIIIDLLGRVSGWLNPFRFYALTSERRFKDSIAEHTGMIDRILAHDLEGATRLCALHLAKVKEESLKHLPTPSSGAAR